MVKTSKVKFDGEKLRLELVRRGVSMKRASEELGFNSSYVKKMCDLGEMRQSIVTALEGLYLIKPELYVIKEEELEKEEPKQEALDYDALYRCIYKAVYDAVKKAWAE